MNKSMKKIFIASLILMSAVCTGLQAQNHKKEIVVTGQSVDKTDDNTVVVSFRADVGKRAARAGRSVVFVPTLTNGTYKWSLPAIVVQGRRAEVADLRHDWVSGTAALQPAFDDRAILSGNGNTITYKTAVDWQLWMDGADLVAEILTMGCCSYDSVEEVLLYGNAQLPPVIIEEKPVVAVAQEVALPPQTTGEKLAESYPFIVPASEFEKLAPGQLFDEDRENSLQIFFRQGRYNIDDSFSGNGQALVDLMSSIRIIQNSRDSRVKTIVIAGFASPEGTFDLNDRLAFDRAVAVKKYIMDHSGLADGDIQVYNGSEDWRGLRMLVEQSDMNLRDRVLAIIDNTPVWDSQMQRGRLGELMRLDEGRPYKYMYDNFFPRLRNAAYIKIYYENR